MEMGGEILKICYQLQSICYFLKMHQFGVSTLYRAQPPNVDILENTQHSPYYTSYNWVAERHLQSFAIWLVKSLAWYLIFGDLELCGCKWSMYGYTAVLIVTESSSKSKSNSVVASGGGGWREQSASWLLLSLQTLCIADQKLNTWLLPKCLGNFAPLPPSFFSKNYQKWSL